MTIKEIEAQLQIAQAAPIEKDGTSEWWNLLPRVSFPDLPKRYKDEVRERFTADILHDFLRQCYSPLAEITRKYAPQEVAAFEEKTATTVEGFLSFDSMIADIPANILDKLLIKARNNAVYTIEAPDAPMLYGNHACEAFENVIDEYQAATSAPAEKRTRRTARKAAAATRFVSAGYYQTIISDKQYQHALTTQQNKNAYVAIATPELFSNLNLHDGTVTCNDEIMGIIKKNTRGKYEDISEINFPFLVQSYTAAFKSAQTVKGFTITVYIPQFFKEMGVDMNGGKGADVMKQINAFKDLVGIMPKEQTVSTVFSIIDIDAAHQTMTFAAPYFFRLFDKLDDKNHIERNTKKGALISYDRPYHNRLVHSTIASERNKPAVELVYLMTTGLLQRGFIPDAGTYNKRKAKNVNADMITYSISFRTLLNNAPLLRARVNSIESTANKNRALRNAFSKAYELMTTKTDAPQYFCNLKYDTNCPTMTTLDGVITFTHTGRDGNYKPHI